MKIRIYLMLSLLIGLNGLLQSQNCTIEGLRGSLESKWLFGATPSINSVVNHLCTQVPPPLTGTDFYTGSWPDIDYHDQSSSGWDPSNHLENLTELAEAYALGVVFDQDCGGNNYTEDDLENAIINGLKFWYNFSTNPTCNPNPCPCATACPCSESWFKNTIGKELELQRIGIFAWDILSANNDDVNGMTLLEHIINDLSDNPTDCNDSDLYTGANLANVAGSMLVRGILSGLLSGDETLINEGLDALSLALDFAPQPDNESIQWDYSFHQHGALLYNGGYGLSFLEVAAPWAATIRDCSNYNLDGGEERLINFVLDGFRRMTIANNTDYPANGRNIARPYPNNNAAVPDWVMDCLVYMAEGTPEEADLMAMRADIDAENLQNLTGNKYFWKSDYVSHMEAGSYFSSVRMSSGRTIGTENESDENLKGYWLPFGSTFIYKEGDEYIRYDGTGSQTNSGNYINIFPQWDWAKIPGVTSPDVVPPLDDEGPCPDQSGNDTAFVGSAGNENHGVSVMEVQDSYSYGGNNCGNNSGTMSAKKSWFHFGAEVVALGIDITGADLHTTINQCLMNGSGATATIDQNSGSSTIVTGMTATNYAAVNSITHDGIDYIFPNAPDIMISTLEGTGDWEDIALGEGDYDDDLREYLFTAWIPHNGNNNYYYIIDPDQDYADDILLLSNDANIQAVKKEDETGYSDLVGAAFYMGNIAIDVGNQGASLTLQPNHPCALFFTESNLEVCISSPDRAHDVIELTVNSNVQNPVIFNLPDGGGHFGGTSTCLSFSDFTICQSGDPFQIIAHSVLDIPSVGYNWTVSPSQGVTFTNNIASPAITFSNVGSYEISQTITLNGHSVTTTRQIEIGSTPDPLLISATELDPCYGIWNFTINRDEDFSHLWSVDINGNIEISTDQSPDFTFDASGSYTVNYTATDACGTSSSTSTTVTVTMSTMPIPNITVTPDSECSSNAFSFTSDADDALSHLWEFEDTEDGLSIEQNPSYLFTLSGDYTVTYTATDDCGSIASATLTLTVDVGSTPPNPIINGAPVAGCTSTFDFTSTNNDDASSHYWDFGDGISTEQNPTHFFSEAGDHIVMYAATYECGIIVTETLEVTVSEVPDALVPAISSSQTAGCPSVAFMGDGAYTGHYWDFGDDQSSTDQNPAHDYTAIGTYNVTYLATDDCGNTGSVTLTVVVDELVSVASFTVAPDPCVGSVTFDNNSTYADSYLWNFGDGNSSTEENPENNYIASGSYTVSLTSSNNCGSDVSTATLNVMDCSGICDCPAGNTLISIPNDAVINISDYSVNGNTPYCFEIGENAQLVINENTTISGSVFIMEASSEIVVESGFQFTSDGNTYNSCTSMWKGISVPGGGSIVFNNNIIRDAQYAIKAENQAEITVQNNDFENNYIGFYLSSTSTVGTIISNNPFTGNHFSCPSGLLAPYTGQNPEPGTTSAVGIKIINISDFAVGTEDAQLGEPNTIDGHHVGILARGSNLDVYHAGISNLVRASGYIPELYSWGGIGIKAISTNLLFHDSDIYGGAKYIHGINTSRHDLTITNNCQFTDLYIGVFALGYHNTSQVSIEDSEFHCYHTGIYLANSQSARFNITNNQIYTDPGWPGWGSAAIAMFGVKGEAVSNDFPTLSLIEHNIIYSNFTVHGMRFSASTNFNILDNDLYFTNTSNNPARRLITIQGVDEQGQNVNILLKGNDLYGTGTAVSVNSPAGIDIWNSGDVSFCCNTINDTDIGIMFNGMNPGTNLRGTTFNNLYDRGLLLGTSTVIGSQFEGSEQMPTLLYGNQWLNGTASGGAEHLGSEEEASQSRFIVNPLLNGAMPDPVLSGDPNWFTPFFVENVGECSTGSDCNIPMMIPPGEPTETDKRIADGSMSTSLGYNGGVYWEAQRYLYQKLKSNPGLMGQNQQVDQFYNSKSTGTIGVFQQLDNGIADLYDPNHPYAVQLSTLQDSVNVLLQQIRTKNNLLADPDLPNRQAVIQEKSNFQLMLSNVFSDYYQRQNSLEQYRAQEADNLITSNNNITTSFVFESNRKTSNQIYLNTVAKGIYDLDAGQTAAIEAVASQCPLSGGNAVYLARSLLSMVKDTIFDDELLCGMANPYSEKEDERTPRATDSKVVLYPNPAKDIVHISFEAPLESPGTLVLYDMLGKEVLVQQLEIGNQFFTFSSKELTTGIYYCSIVDTNGIDNLGKLIIQQ